MGVDMTDSQMSEHFEDGHYVPFYVTMPLSKQKPGIPAYKKPVYALTNGGCYSTTDICLTILDEYKRIIVIGSPNGAGSGSPIPMVLPNAKVKVMVPHARAYPPSGRMIEGRPLEPAVLVEVTQEDLVAGIDRHLATALEMAAEKTGLVTGITRSATTELSLNPSELDTTEVMDTTGSIISEELRILIPDSVREAYLMKAMLKKAAK